MIDPEVSQLKFQRALAQLDGGAAGFAGDAGWVVIGRTYPLFEVIWTHPRTKRQVGFRFNFDSWDAIPPSLELFDPDTKATLQWERWPQGGWAVGSPHPLTQKPFLCLPGIREFHDHPSHTADAWPALRGLSSYSMLYLMQRVQQRFEDSNG